MERIWPIKLWYNNLGEAELLKAASQLGDAQKYDINVEINFQEMPAVAGVERHGYYQ